MSTKAIAWVVIAIIVIGGGWYLWSQHDTGGMTAGEEQMTGSSTPTQNGATASDPAMVGTWQSTDDAKFTRTFNVDGTVTDAYQGDASATETGTYAVVDPLKEPAGAFGAASPESLTGMTILKLTFPSSGVMYFGVQSETESNLQLLDISGRGNILSFTKIQ